MWRAVLQSTKALKGVVILLKRSCYAGDGRCLNHSSDLVIDERLCAGRLNRGETVTKGSGSEFLPGLLIDTACGRSVKVVGKPLGSCSMSGVVTLILVAAMFAPTGTRRQTPTGRNNVVTSDAIARRVAAAGGQSGDVQCSLAWSNYNDLDLWVVHDGEKIFFGHPREAFGRGSLDVDMNVSPETNRPCENIFWPRGSSPRGDFEVYVDHFRRHGRADPTPTWSGASRKAVSGLRAPLGTERGPPSYQIHPRRWAGMGRRDLMPLAPALLLAFWIGYVVVGIRLFRATPEVQHTGEVVGAGDGQHAGSHRGPHMGEAFPLVARCLHVGRAPSARLPCLETRWSADIMRRSCGIGPVGVSRITPAVTAYTSTANAHPVRYVHAGDLIEVGRTVLRPNRRHADYAPPNGRIHAE